MNDRHVDELLSELDRALAVEPSASVAARVRLRMAETPAAGWFGLHGRLVLFTGAAAVVAVVGAGYIARLRTSEVPASAPSFTSHRSDIPTAHLPPPQAVTEHVPRSQGVAATPTLAVVEREPEVLVSPSQKIALAQLAAAVRDGRINADSFSADLPAGPLEKIVVAPVAIEVFNVERLESSSNGGGVIR